MIPDTEEVEVPSDEDIFPIEVEKAPPKDPEEAFRRYVEVLEKQTAAVGEDFPPYDVEMVVWPRGGHGRRITLSKRVHGARSILKTLLVFRGIIKEFEEDEG